MAEEAFAAIYTHITTILGTTTAGAGTFATLASTGEALGAKLLEVSMGVFLAGAVVVLTKVLAPVITGLREVKESNEIHTQQVINKANKFLAPYKEKADLPKIKPDPPEIFDGKPSHVMPFLTTLHVYFDAIQEKNLHTKTIFALSRIKGGKDDIASNWAAAKRTELVAYSVLKEQAEEQPNNEELQEQFRNTPKVFNNWKDFTDQFQAHFMLTNEGEMARDALDVLEMGNGSCKEYTTKFNGYAMLTGYDQIYLLRKYKEGLTKALRNKVIGTHPVPATLKDWKATTLTMD